MGEESLFFMAKVRVATYNILLRLSRWDKRLPLIVKELDELDADIICLQEVVIPNNTAEEIAARLKNKYYVTTVAGYRNPETHGEMALAILSKKPPTETSQLDLGTKEKRIAMRATFKYGFKEFDVVNTHLFWMPIHPMNRKIRTAQVKKILSWAKSDREVIITGDMNATPNTGAIKVFWQSGFRSVYMVANGREPDYTCANPMGPPDRTLKEISFLAVYNLIRRWRLGVWRGVMDYVFVSSGWAVLTAGIFGDKPDPEDKHLYPSDHRGVYGDLRLKFWKSK